METRKHKRENRTGYLFKNVSYSFSRADAAYTPWIKRKMLLNQRREKWRWVGWKSHVPCTTIHHRSWRAKNTMAKSSYWGCGNVHFWMSISNVTETTNKCENAWTRERVREMEWKYYRHSERARHRMRDKKNREIETKTDETPRERKWARLMETCIFKW